MDFSVIFCQVGRSGWAIEWPDTQPNVVGLVEIHSLFARRVSGFGQIRFAPIQIDRIDG